MPDFEITSPDGKRFVVTAPEGAKPEEVLSYAQQQFAPAKPQEDPARVAAREANSTPGGLLSGTKRAIESGLTFGLRDEAQAGIDALVNAGVSGVAGLFRGRQAEPGKPTGLADTYEQSLARERTQSQQFQEDHPVLSTAGNVVGGALVPGQMGAGLIRGPGVVAGLGRGAVAGGAGGAAAGFGEGEGGLVPRTQNALMGGAIGLGGGLALGAGVQAGGALLGRAGHALGLRNPETAADRQTLRALDRAGVTVDDAEARLAAGGDAPLALVDVGGRNTVNLGATAANTPGAAMDAADALVQGRRRSRPDRLTNAGDQAFGGGSGGDIAATTAARQAQRAAEAGPRYEAAFSRITPTADEVARVEPGITDHIGQEALQRGLRVMEVENVGARLRDPDAAPFDPADYGVTRGEDGRFVVTDGHRNLRLLDAVKRGYDEIVEGFRDPTSGRLNLDQYGRAVNDARAGYVGQLREMFPRYGGALDAWAGPSAQMDATAAGQTAFRTNRDVVAQRMQAPPDVQDAYRLGAGRDFSNRVSDPQAAPGTVRDLLEDHSQIARLNSLLDPQAKQALDTVLRRENDMVAVERAISPRAGSPTKRLTAGGEDMGRDPVGPWATALMQATTGGWNGMGRAVGTITGDAWRRVGQGINPATSDALANRLFATDPAARQAVIQQLRNRLMQDAQTQDRARIVGGRLLQGIGVGSGLAAD